MKKLSEYRGTEAVDLLCELIDPFAEIAGDADIRAMISEKKPAAVWIAAALRAHKGAFIRMASAITGEAEEDMNVLTLPRLALQILSDEDFLELFRSAAQTEAVTSSAAQSESAPDAD